MTGGLKQDVVIQRGTDFQENQQPRADDLRSENPGPQKSITIQRSTAASQPEQPAQKQATNSSVIQRGSNFNPVAQPEPQAPKDQWNEQIPKTAGGKILRGQDQGKSDQTESSKPASELNVDESGFMVIRAGSRIQRQQAAEQESNSRIQRNTNNNNPQGNFNFKNKFDFTNSRNNNDQNPNRFRNSNNDRKRDQ